jgi:hypothetical protein
VVATARCNSFLTGQKAITTVATTILRSSEGFGRRCNQDLAQSKPAGQAL